MLFKCETAHQESMSLFAIPTNYAYKTLVFYFEIEKINRSNSSRSLFEVFTAQQWRYISYNEASM